MMAVSPLKTRRGGSPGVIARIGSLCGQTSSKERTCTLSRCLGDDGVGGVELVGDLGQLQSRAGLAIWALRSSIFGRACRPATGRCGPARGSPRPPGPPWSRLVAELEDLAADGVGDPDVLGGDAAEFADDRGDPVSRHVAHREDLADLLAEAGLLLGDLRAEQDRQRDHLLDDARSSASRASWASPPMAGYFLAKSSCREASSFSQIEVFGDLAGLGLHGGLGVFRQVSCP